MFWEKELIQLAERSRSLAAVCALDRERVTGAAADLARKLVWLDAARTWGTRYRSVFLVGLPVAGLFLGKRLPRLARWTALAAPFWRAGRGLLRFWRTGAR